MNDYKHLVKKGVVLFIFGLIGVLSILTMEIPLPAEAEAMLNENFSPVQVKLLLLINPAFLLLGAVIIGTLFHQKVGLRVPILENAIAKNGHQTDVISLIKYGVIGGIIGGILVLIIGYIFNPILPAEFKELGEKLKPSLAARFLYGGITEEILVRYGIMTFLIWILSKIFKEKPPFIYWLGILIAAIIFALGHFPIAYQAVGNPSTLLLIFILIGNSIGGIIFGWLYWKRGLESAIVGHIFLHIILVSYEAIL